MEKVDMEADIAASTAAMQALQSLDPDEQASQRGMAAPVAEDQQMGPAAPVAEDQQMGPAAPVAEDKSNSDQVTFRETKDGLGRRQSDMALLIGMQQRLALLPSREIPVYDGNPLTFQSFTRAFNYLVEDRISSSQDRLYYLEQYTSGQPRNLVRSCLHMEPHQGYAEARRLLGKQFGNEVKITNAYLEKALNWTDIKADDGLGLQDYALYLRGCYNAMQDLQYMDELDITSNLRLMTSKLPYRLRDKWRAAAYDTLQRTGGRARFINLVEFMERHAEILLDPLFGDIQDRLSGRKEALKTSTSDRQQSTPPKSRWSSFATTVAIVADEHSTRHSFKPQQQGTTQDTPAGTCGFCQGKHTLTDCVLFKTQCHETKIECLKGNRLCFGCLTKGHLNRDCKRKLTCQKCLRRHPTVLHIESIGTSYNKPRQQETSVSSALVSAGEGTGAGKDCALAIVPVRVKVAKEDRFILTYAFLDPGSSATFCTESLMEQLKAKGRRTEILLRTMGQERPVRSYELTGLEVGNLEGSICLDLPSVYTQDRIPVSKENIPSQKDLEKWPHLKGIQLDEIDADIGLLIGINVPKAMEPWHVINSKGNGPYAVKTVLGWVVNGPLNSYTAMEESQPPVMMVNRIAITDQEKSLLQHKDLMEEGQSLESHVTVAGNANIKKRKKKKSATDSANGHDVKDKGIKKKMKTKKQPAEEEKVETTQSSVKEEGAVNNELRKRKTTKNKSARFELVEENVKVERIAKEEEEEQELGKGKVLKKAKRGKRKKRRLRLKLQFKKRRRKQEHRMSDTTPEGRKQA